MTKHLTILTGSSRGMGLAMGQQLLAKGHTMLGIARRSSPALAACAASADQLIQWEQDLAATDVACQRLLAWLDSLHAADWASITLINNAGVVPHIAPLSGVPTADLCNALRVGLEAPMALTGAFLAATEHWHMPKKVLNISSGLGRRAMASQAGYCAAKAGMDAYARCVALEEARKPLGAKIVSLAPGVIDTDMQIHLRSANASAFPDVDNFISLKAKGTLRTPVHAAAQVLAWLDRADFGESVIADVRQP